MDDLRAIEELMSKTFLSFIQFEIILEYFSLLFKKMLCKSELRTHISNMKAIHLKN